MVSSFVWGSELKNHLDMSKVKYHIWVIDLYTNYSNKYASVINEKTSYHDTTPMEIGTFSCQAVLYFSVLAFIHWFSRYQRFSRCWCSAIWEINYLCSTYKGEVSFSCSSSYRFTNLSFFCRIPFFLFLLSTGQATNAETWAFLGISHGALDLFSYPSQNGFLLKCRGSAFEAFPSSWTNHAFRPCSLYLTELTFVDR